MIQNLAPGHNAETYLNYDKWQQVGSSAQCTIKNVFEAVMD